MEQFKEILMKVMKQNCDVNLREIWENPENYSGNFSGSVCKL